MNFGRGRYKTKSGLSAVVSRVVSEKGHWILRGLIEGPKTGAFFIAKWNSHGECLSADNTNIFDLIAESKDDGSH